MPGLVGVSSSCSSSCARSGEVQAGGRGDVERGRADGVDAVIERRSEAAEVDDQIGVLQRGGVASGQLEVVRFGSGRRDVGDLHEVAADLLGDELQRVERRHDVERRRRRDRSRTASGLATTRRRSRIPRRAAPPRRSRRQRPTAEQPDGGATRANLTPSR